MRPTRAALIVIAAVAALVACRNSLDYGDGAPTILESPTPTPITSPTPIPATPYGFGDGHDGSPDVVTATQVVPCDPVLNTAGSVLTLNPGTPHFLAGDLVLVVQIADRGFTTALDTTGAMTDTLDAGKWQIARVSSAASPNATLDTALHWQAQSGGGHGRAVACKMAQYRSVTVENTGEITTSPWDGVSGGVIAFFVSSDLALVSNKSIDATGLGSPGGSPATNPSASTHVAILDLPLSDGRGGGKGLGLDTLGVDRAARGAWANGGGGGNSLGGGGGGGGNGGRGGRGGDEAESVGQTIPGGVGGLAIAPAGSRLVLGGGGGTGAFTAGGTAGKGGTGGGIVVIVARSVSGAGDLHADGADGLPGTLGGGGGGGGGGTLFLVSDDVSGWTGVATARGGTGATLGNTLYGPGGGGGGGVVGVPLLAGSNQVLVGSGQRGLASTKDRGAVRGQSGVRIDFVN